MFVSYYEFIKYRTRLLLICEYRRANILFHHFHQSKQKSFAPPLFALALLKFPAGYVPA